MQSTCSYLSFLQTSVEDKESGNTIAAVNCYFMSQDGSMFKAQVAFSPYFYLQTKVRPPAKLTCMLYSGASESQNTCHS
jgi:hypothetical protein